MTDIDDGTSSLPDRISSLPNDVLCHILSFLPTKSSVRTRILSTRWKYLYASVPVLDFVSTTGTAKQAMFEEFVSRVLNNYNVSQITKFRLICDFVFSENSDHFSSWMSSILCRDILEIDIDAAFRVPQTLPSQIFSSKLLSILTLEGDFHLKLPSSAFLPCLKTLDLTGIYFDDSAGRIASICPMLKVLLLSACDFENVKVLDISHSILRELHIRECDGYELMLNAPSLINFVCVNSAPSGIRGEIVLKSLDKSILRIDSESSLYDVGVIVKLVTAVSYARHLFLSTFVIEALRGCKQALPTFHKLAILEVGEVSKLASGLLPDLLNRCPLLRVLIFTKGCSYEEINKTDMLCYNDVPLCVSTCLKVIQFSKFRKRKIEYKLMEYFLDEARVLENMKIETDFGLYYKFSQKMSTIYKASRNCQIQVVIG